MRTVASCLLFIAITGCRRETPAPIPKRPPVLGVEITRLTPLPPDRRTHITSTGSGQIFWVQEAEGGQRETVFSLSEGGLPAATRLSNSTVLEAMGKGDARGSIQSLTVGADGKLYFYFTGGTKKQLLAAFGSFSPESGKTQILSDTIALARESRLGDSLALARGSVVRVGDVLWLWLRHDDGYALLSLDVTRVGSALRQTFEQVHMGDEELRLTSPSEDLTRGAGNTLVYLDRRSARLWRIAPLGEASLLQGIADLPRNVTAPAALFQEQPQFPIATRPAVEYPALVILDGDQRTILARETFIAPERLNIRNLAPPTLVRDRSTLLAYDAQTGELLRLRVVER
jgi:hypothetical protein